MSIRGKVLATVLVGLSPACAWADDAKAPDLDKKVVGIVKEAGALYKNAKSLHADVVLDTIATEGTEKREINITATIDLAKPNRFAFRSRHQNDANAGLEVFCDGKAFYAHGRRLKQYTEAKAPANLTGVGKRLTQFPPAFTGMLLANVLADDPADMLLDGVTACSYAGKEKMGDTFAHHLKFKQDALDWEMWVAAEGKPFALKMTNTHTTDNGKVVSTETYKNWKLDAEPAKDAFAFTAPADAKKVKAFGNQSNDG